MIMKPIKKKIIRRKRRHLRIRKRVFGTKERPRLSVFRSLKNICCQLIDDVEGKTLVSVSSLSKEIKENVTSGEKKKVAELVGEKVANDALNKGIKEVVFDRGGYKFHGRVKSLAEGARKTGLIF
ncbi:MAG: 50S ribosomal protein L18 [Candidatus Anammoxibacter sp.]